MDIEMGFLTRFKYSAFFFAMLPLLILAGCTSLKDYQHDLIYVQKEGPLRTDGFYQEVDGSKLGTILILYEDGSCLEIAHYHKSINRFLDDLKKDDTLLSDFKGSGGGWGGYFLSYDHGEITLQTVIRSPSGLPSLPSYQIYERKGTILNDTTILITDKHVNDRTGVITESKLVFEFTPLLHKPDSTNWLKRRIDNKYSVN
jgi:hypothetical protein